MQFAIIQCFEIGMHMLIPLDIIGLLIGAGIQFLLCKKAKNAFSRYIFTIVDLAGMLISDIAAQIVTGYDLLIPLFTYWLFFMLLVGALVCVLVLRLTKKQ